MKFFNFRKIKKIGLALGSGSARGLVHIGVLKAIDEYGIKLDYIAGSSIGAFIGGAYALGTPISEIEKIALQTDWKLVAKIFSPSLSLSSIANSKYLNEFLKTFFGATTFENLKIPFEAVASDIKTGEPVILNQGSLITAVRASISIPVLFAPVSIANRKLVDGGLVNPTPVDLVKAKKMDTIIAVNLRRNYSANPSSEELPAISEDSALNGLSINEKIQYFLKHPVDYFSSVTEERPQEMRIWEVMYQSFDIVQDHIGDLTMKIAKPDILIEPKTEGFSLFDFNRAPELIEIGYNIARTKLKVLESK